MKYFHREVCIDGRKNINFDISVYAKQIELRCHGLNDSVVQMLDKIFLRHQNVFGKYKGLEGDEQVYVLPFRERVSPRVLQLCLEPLALDLMPLIFAYEEYLDEVIHHSPQASVEGFLHNEEKDSPSSQYEALLQADAISFEAEVDDSSDEGELVFAADVGAKSKRERR